MVRTSSSLLPRASQTSSGRRHFFLTADSESSPSAYLQQSRISSWLSMSEHSSGGLLGVASSSVPMSKPARPEYRLVGFVMCGTLPTLGTDGMTLSRRRLAEEAAIVSAWRWFCHNRDRWDIPFVEIVKRVQARCPSASVEYIRAG